MSVLLTRPARTHLLRFSLLLLLHAGYSTSETKASFTEDKAGEVALAQADSLRSEQLESSNRSAVQKYREAAKLFLVIGEPAHASVALRNAGEVLDLMGSTQEALACYQEALVLADKARDLTERARILNDLAYLHFIAGDSKAAQNHALKALKIASSLRNKEIEARALSNLGESFYGLGDLKQARQHQQRSLEIWRELNNTRGEAIASIALGYYHNNLSEHEKALRSLTDGLSLARHSGDLAVEATALIALCSVQRKAGNNQGALELYPQAKRIADRIGDQTAQAMILGGMGSIHLRMGNLRQALGLISEATLIMERNGKKWGVAEGKIEIGRIYHSLDEQDQALRYLTEALDLFRSLRMPRLELSALREIGLVHETLGDRARALRSYQAALKLVMPGQDLREESFTLNNIGHIYEELNDRERALHYYTRALPLAQRSQEPIAEYTVGYNIAHVQRDRGNLTEARRQIEATLEIIELHRKNVTSQDLRTSYFADMRKSYELYIDILLLMHGKDPQSGFDKKAFEFSEMARARSFYETLLEARAKIRQGVDPALLGKEKQLSEALNATAQQHVQLLAARRSDEAAEVNKKVDSLVSELTQVRDQIRSASPRLEMPPLLGLQEVQQRVLDDDTILLEYVLADKRSYVWVITKSRSFSYELSARAEIEASVTRLYNLITASQMVYGESTAARKARAEQAAVALPGETAVLSNLLLGPLKGKLDKRKLQIVPDGALQSIPFALLTNPDSGIPLLATHEISYTPSASTLAFLQTEAGKRQRKVESVAVIADPVFEADDPRLNQSSSNSATDHNEVRQALRDVGISPDGVQIPRLLASGTEANAIMNVAPWRTALKAVGFAANRDRVLGSELANYRIVHFATHGIVNNEHPELSGIVLSLFDSEGRPQDGFLRLHDIYNLQLSADLVVLSACSTGLGKDVRGEGVIGLARGFMHAGASGVIASLWKVDDDATAELMKHFYAGLFKRNLSPAAALREAQLAVSKNKRWESPYYWAGFVLQGQYTQNQKFTEPFPSRLHVALFASLSGVILVAGPILIARRRRRRGI